MSIYTRTGDNGMTALYDNKRLLKSDLQVEAYGSLDELSSFIGLVTFKLKNKKNKEILTCIQKDLFSIMAILAGNKKSSKKLEKAVNKIEQIIDFLSTKLPKLNRFILPQGSQLSCWFHVLRTVCRRCERNVVRSFESNKNPPSVIYSQSSIIRYLNRLSDLFFIFSRWYNTKKEVII